jgi:mannonate dehydratase
MEASGLVLSAIENFDPVQWYDVLLDGPRKQEQLDHLKELVRRVGRAGIPVLGYNFSIAGVASRITGPFARGQAESVGMQEVDERPIPKGMVWNMVYDPDAPSGYQESATEEELWRRFSDFLQEVVPVAEEAGVVLAAHPDDPPASRIRQQPRLVWRPELYDRVLDLYPSRSNKLEFCLGTLAEMPDHDIYATVRHYLERDAIGYIHFRNVRGVVPSYAETFIDDGDVDMHRVMSLLCEHDYEGVLVPDHTPQMTCDAPWHAGMAYAIGYMRGLARSVGAAQ